MTSFTDTPVINLLPTRLCWIRLNRVLAWSLLLLPPAQFICHIELGIGMLVMLGLTAVHGGLSFVLFGLPKLRDKGLLIRMHVFGIRPAGLSARNHFLLTGYRIALGMSPVAIGMLDLSWYCLLPFLYPILRLPLTILQHILDAVRYALRRWGRSEELAAVAVFLYMLSSAANVIAAMVAK